jgi:hypothetical protein
MSPHKLDTCDSTEQVRLLVLDLLLVVRQSAALIKRMFGALFVGPMQRRAEARWTRHWPLSASRPIKLVALLLIA